jgi:hypothetical protein
MRRKNQTFILWVAAFHHRTAFGSSLRSPSPAPAEPVSDISRLSQASQQAAQDTKHLARHGEPFTANPLFTNVTREIWIPSGLVLQVSRGAG